jgi:hypothetical protein
MTRVIFYCCEEKEDRQKLKHLFLFVSIILLILSLTFVSFNYTLFTAHAQSSDSNWHLNVNGLVDHPLNLTLSDLEALPQTTVPAAIYCVDFPTTVVTQGNWQGVKLWTLLSLAGVIPGAFKVAFSASDGYQSDLTIDQAKNDNIIVAYAKDGAPLSEVLRLVVPGHWGYKWVSQVVGIEIVNYDFKGKWESQGYSDDGSFSQTNFPSNPISPSPSIPALTIPLASPSPTETLPISPRENSTSPYTSAASLAKNPTQQILNTIGTVAVVAAVAAIVLAVAIKRRKAPLQK